MIDLSRELSGLSRVYEQLALRQSGVVLQFIGVHIGCGVSTCARAFARMMAPRSSRGIWLFDLDFYTNTHFQMFSSPKAQALYGALGPATAMAQEGQPLFWRIHPELVREDGRKAGDRYYMNMHRVGAHSLYVSHFRSDLLRPKQHVHLRPSKTYWEHVRTKADLTIIDAPVLHRSRGGLVTAVDADGVVIVAHPADPKAQIQKVQQQIEGRGGRCLGVIYNAVPRQGMDPVKQAAQ